MTTTRTYPVLFTRPRLLHMGEGSLDQLGILLDKADFDVATTVVCGGGTRTRHLVAAATASIAAAGGDVILICDVAGSLSDAAVVASRIIESDARTVVGVGGGRVIDVAKLAAARSGVDFVSVPTTVAHDGLSSPVASLRDGTGERRSYQAATPAGIVIDTALLSGSPAATKRSGLGDLTSNLTAVMDWQLADERGRDAFDSYAAMIARAAATLTLTLADVDSLRSIEVLAEGLVLSGLAMAAAGTSRPCSGAEHLISHALDAKLKGRARLHGEQVAVATVFCRVLHGMDVAPVRNLFSRCGVPARPSEIGISLRTFADAVLAAPLMRPERYTILDEIELGFDAVMSRVRDAFGEDGE